MFRRRLIKVLSLTLFGVLVAAITAEIGARIMVARGLLPNRMAADIFAAHPIGWTLEPDLDVHIFTTNGLVRIQTNSAGFRDREYPRARADAVTRVLVLGDSFTLALETAQQDTFHEQLEAQFGGQVEVISMAASGYGPAQELLAYEHIGRDFAPDMVLVMFYVGNDPLDSDRWEHLPYYEVDGENLVLRQFPYKGPFNLPLVVGQRSNFVMRQSMLAFLLGVVTRGQGRTLVTETNSCAYLIAENYPDADATDWQITEKLLLTLRDSVEADGAAFRLAVIPTELQVQDDYMADFSARCTMPTWATSLTYQQDRLIPFLDANNITYLDLRPSLRADAESTELYFSDVDIHWTPHGHEVVAGVLANWLPLLPDSDTADR